MTEDFYHLPFQLLSSGLERLMKCYICLVYEANERKFPTYKYLSKDLGHDLSKLKKEISNKYFKTNNIPALEKDIDFLDNTPLLDKVLHVLSAFGKFARYYNLDIITGNTKAVFNPNAEWEDIEKDILKTISGFQYKRLLKRGDEYYQKINMEIVKIIEKFTRAIARQFTLGQHGDKLQQLSITSSCFRNLGDCELGQKDYRIASKILKEQKDKWHSRKESKIFNGKHPARKLHRNSFDGEWPFRSDEVIVECRDELFCIVNINGYDFALNGAAKSKFGYPDPHDMGLAILGKSIGPFINIAFELTASGRKV
ncbi:hypothetical protein KA005_51455 [bacterium]|nr:hypothetical protein [bacterium]